MKYTVGIMIDEVNKSPLESNNFASKKGQKAKQKQGKVSFFAFHFSFTNEFVRRQYYP